jgi:hypothetical protein
MGLPSRAQFFEKRGYTLKAEAPPNPFFRDLREVFPSAPNDPIVHNALIEVLGGLSIAEEMVEGLETSSGCPAVGGPWFFFFRVIFVDWLQLGQYLW